MPLAPFLTAAQVAQFHTDGFVIVPDLLTAAECEAFIQGAATMTMPPGSGLQYHRADPGYRAMAHHPRQVAAMRQVLGGAPQIVQTMYLNKAPGGVGIAMHQDCHYLRNDPNTLAACWVALVDTDAGNGGLCMVRGSHQDGLRSVHRNLGGKEHDNYESHEPMRDRDGKEWVEHFFRFEIDGIDAMPVERLTVPRGAGVIFTGLTIHGSYGNHTTDRPRRAFATHYVREGTWLFRKDVQDLVPAVE